MAVMLQWLAIAFLHFLAATQYSLAQSDGDCRDGNLRLMESTYSGILLYCDSTSGEWIGVCGLPWNRRILTGVCRQIPTEHILHNDTSFSEISDEHSGSILLDCPWNEPCVGTFTTMPCPGINITCQGSCTSRGSCYYSDKRDPPLCICAGMTCSSQGVCGCSDGLGGERCRSACEPPCANGGTCSTIGECRCRVGWEGGSCNEWDCEGTGKCLCTLGWTGSHCEQAICSPSCINGNCTHPNQCNCAMGWEGAQCELPICDQQCRNRGNSSSPNNCSCTEGWAGPTYMQGDKVSSSAHKGVVILSVLLSIALLTIALLVAAIAVIIIMKKRKSRGETHDNFEEFSINTHENAAYRLLSDFTSSTMKSPCKATPHSSQLDVIYENQLEPHTYEDSEVYENPASRFSNY